MFVHTLSNASKHSDTRSPTTQCDTAELTIIHTCTDAFGTQLAEYVSRVSNVQPSKFYDVHHQEVQAPAQPKH
eukprot:2917690-Rhodomonas_salina.2